MNLQEICLALTRELHKLVPYDRAAINLPHDDGVYFSVYAEESRLPGSAIPEGVSVVDGTATGWALQQRAPVICRDVLEDDRFPLTHKRYRTVGIRSYVILPLMAGDEVLGVLNLGSTAAGRFGPKEIDILSPVAAILSRAIENSRLYEESQKREEMQKLLKELSQDITSLDIDSLLQKLTKKIRAVLGADVSDFRLMEEGEWRSLGVSGTEAGLLQPGGAGAGRGLSRSVLQNRRPLAIPDMMAGDARRSERSITTRHGFRGYVGVPLFSRGGDVIGVLRVLTYEIRRFTPAEVDLLEQLAGGAAIAIENARLFKEVRQKSRDLEATNLRLDSLLREQSAMREVFSRINLLDLDQMLDQLAGHAMRLLGVDSVLVLLAEGEALRTVFALGRGAEIQRGRVQPLGRGRSGWVMKNLKPLAVENITRDPEFGQGRVLREIEMKGYLGIPLISRRQKAIGLLVATTLAERAFSRDEIAVAEQFAAGAAIAIENATLLEEAIEKSLHLETLIKVNHDVASLLKKDVLLPRIANEAQNFLSVDGVIFRLIEDGRLVTAGHAGADDLAEMVHALPLGQSISGKIVAENRPIAVRDLLEDEALIEEHRRILSRAGYRSFLGVPLRLGHSVIGTLNLYSKQEREFRPEEIRLITAFADQAAITIENARLFEEVQSKSAELEDAFRLKTDFLNAMAHELRTPLNVVIGTQQLLLDGSYGGLQNEQQRAVERIGRYAGELLALINEILDLMRLDAKKVPLHCEEFSARELAEELELSFDPLARGKGLALGFTIDPGVPRLKSDRGKIREILQNLLANAVKYTEKGKVELGVRLEKPAADARDRRVAWSVSDTGIGIGASDLPRIFEPFYMAEEVDRRKYPGSGLGLSIVSRLVELLDGAVRIESAPGKGSTFTVTLPAVHRAELE